MTAAAILHRVAEHLYGQAWTAPLARRLNINVRTLQRCRAAALAGEDYAPAEHVLDAVYDMVDEASEILKAA